MATTTTPTITYPSNNNISNLPNNSIITKYNAISQSTDIPDFYNMLELSKNVDEIKEVLSLNLDKYPIIGVAFHIILYNNDEQNVDCYTILNEYLFENDTNIRKYIPQLQSKNYEDYLSLFTKYEKNKTDNVKKNYSIFFKIKSALDNVDIKNAYQNSTGIESFILLQSKDTIEKYLVTLSQNFPSENTEQNAVELKKKIQNSIVSTLDKFFDNFIKNSKVELFTMYIQKFIELNTIFFPYIAGYNEELFKKILDAVAALQPNLVLVNFKNRINNTSTPPIQNSIRNYYFNKHIEYFKKIDDSLKDFEERLKKEEYGEIKQLLNDANKFIKELQTSYIRFLQIKNIYDEKTEKIPKKEEISKKMVVLQKLLKLIIEKEAFLKDKELNGKQRKNHQFTLGIELLTNVQGNEQMQYTPSMTLPGAGDTLFFTATRNLHENIILDNPNKPPEYKYLQLTKLPDFKSLITRIESKYFLEKDEPFDEYSKVYRKKKHPLTIDNIGIVLDILFKKDSPFFIGSDRYTAFDYYWEKDINKITKNDKKETYGDTKEPALLIPSSNQQQKQQTQQQQQVSQPPPQVSPSNNNLISTAKENINQEISEVGELIENNPTPNNPIINNNLISTAQSNVNQEISEVGELIENNPMPNNPTPNNPIINNNLISTAQSNVNQEISEVGETSNNDQIINDPKTNENDEVGIPKYEEHKERNEDDEEEERKEKERKRKEEEERKRKEEEEEEEEGKKVKKNVDREKNTEYITKQIKDEDDAKIYLTLLHLKQTEDVNRINFKSLIEKTSKYKEGKPLSGGFKQSGGATTLYLDLGEDITLYSQQKKEKEAEIKKQQEDELAFLSKQNEDLNKEELQEVKWKYFITVELQLYPGDRIPLSAYASLKCSNHRNTIFNIWQQIINKQPDPDPTSTDNKPKYKKKMLAYVPVIAPKTLKNKTTIESSNPNSKTVKNIEKEPAPVPEPVKAP